MVVVAVLVAVLVEVHVLVVVLDEVHVLVDEAVLVVVLLVDVEPVEPPLPPSPPAPVAVVPLVESPNIESLASEPAQAESINAVAPNMTKLIFFMVPPTHS
jgi:hypothetical protein